MCAAPGNGACTAPTRGPNLNRFAYTLPPPQPDHGGPSALVSRKPPHHRQPERTYDVASLRVFMLHTAFSNYHHVDLASWRESRGSVLLLGHLPFRSCLSGTASECLETASEPLGAPRLRSERLFENCSKKLCSALLCSVHGYARVHTSVYIYIYIYLCMYTSWTVLQTRKPFIYLFYI